MALLDDVIEAHGGLARRKAFERIEVGAVTTGGLFPLKGLPTDTTRRRMTVWLHEQRASVSPFGAPDQRTSFTADRIAVEKIDGTVVAESRDLPSLFVGHGLSTPWGPLHRAYFNGYAMWLYLNSPFVLAMDGVEVHEIDPWQEGEEQWRVLRAYFPGNMVTHSRQQEFYFDKALNLVRHDYWVDIAGSIPAAQLIGNSVEVQGIRVPTWRRAYARGPDARAVTDLLMVSIDIDDVTFA
ncbi:hypothetical protein [Pseudaminobacter soli (ex Li et al. 2025)]|uniref:Uncharacterized protein n=1 Tax=Pseudaminobacter soli (ex Li et al. 2025) TaxID=1295366 RepID=A0A2P7SJY2_9HYPH|nr:hypothetical protein [Mesorhizobium soli]PSJ62798.1 hypothetical protein C7I85_04195 [Mesorhizobium soli]